MNLSGIPELPGVEHREVDVGGARLHVAEAGSGPPLLLLHGWPQHWWSWRRLIPRLAEDYRVLAPDNRGFGWSDAPPGDYAKSTLAADALALLDAEGIDRVRIVSHDWGAYAALLIALEHPERVERVLALDIVPPWSGRPQLRTLGFPIFATYQALLATPWLGPRTLMRSTRFVRLLIRMSSGREMRWSRDELDVYANVLRQPARAAASAALYRTFLLRELPGMLRAGDRSRELAVQTMIVMGGSSPVRRILHPWPAPNLRVETIPRAGHFLPEEKPDEVLALALPFLAG